MSRTPTQHRADLCKYARWHVADARMAAEDTGGSKWAADYSRARWADAAQCLLMALLGASLLCLLASPVQAQSAEVVIARTFISEIRHGS